MTTTAPLAGQTAIITAAGGAIARATALRLAGDGAALLLMGRSLAPLQAARDAVLAAHPGSEVALHQGDASQSADIQAALSAAHALHNRLDIVIGTLGGGDFRPLIKHDEASFRAALDINLTSAFLLVRHAMPLMPNGGAIVVLSSSVAVKHHEMLVPYSTAKAALETFVQASSIELARQRLRINVVRPGFTRSGGTAPIFGMPDALAQTIAMIPLARPGEPEDIAAAIHFLAGPDASFITGQSIAVDGGGEVNVIAAPRRRS